MWLIILASGLAALLVTDPDAAATAMSAGSVEAVKLAINLVAVYGLWLGFFGILERLGASAFIAKLLHPVIKILFKDIDKETERYITMNMSANLLGLGNASTPMGINAVTRLSQGRSIACRNMIMLVVISATSLQLLPSTVIGMRAAHGSPSPADFLGASVTATVLSTLTGILLVKLCGRLFPDEKAEARELRRLAKRPRRAETGVKTDGRVRVH